ncbi:MAG: hypothetical protein JNK87_27885 [Bryobacterales bacterium]|nr:hypothetical protein [Bryobacterales bacterium]
MSESKTPKLKNVTITLKPEVAQWARRLAAEKNTSVSRLVGEMLEKEMRRTDEYWAAYERWKLITPVTEGLSASERGRREDWYDRSNRE